MTTLETERPVEAAERDSTPSAALALYFRNQGDITNTILSGTGLWINDAEYILQIIAGELPAYDGPDDDEDFVAWALEVAKPTIEKFRFFYELHDKYRGSVSAGIWSVLNKNRDLRHYKSLKETALDIADTVWVWVFDHLEQLAEPGTATLVTRLYAAARFVALTWRKTRLRERQRDSGIDVERIGMKDGKPVVDDEEDISYEEALPYEVSDGPDGLYCLEPSCSENDSEPAPRQSLRKPIRISDDTPSAISGTPRLLCGAGCGMQQVVADCVKDTELVLQCGHVRPVAA